MRSTWICGPDVTWRDAWQVHEKDEMPDELANAFCPAAAWVSVPRPPPPEVIYEQGDGVDVCVDGLRFLPYNATVTKVVGTVHYGPDFERLAGVSVDGVIDPDTEDVFFPEFVTRTELRGEVPDDSVRGGSLTSLPARSSASLAPPLAKGERWSMGARIGARRCSVADCWVLGKLQVLVLRYYTVDCWTRQLE